MVDVNLGRHWPSTADCVVQVARSLQKPGEKERSCISEVGTAAAAVALWQPRISLQRGVMFEVGAGGDVEAAPSVLDCAWMLQGVWN